MLDNVYSEGQHWTSGSDLRADRVTYTQKVVHHHRPIWQACKFTTSHYL